MYEGGSIKADEGNWIILRCLGRNTLRLAASLSADGITAWTPSERITLRTPRRNSRRVSVVPVMPGYVFVREGHKFEMLALARAIERGEGTKLGRPNHHGFSVWLSDNRAWAVSEQDMQGLRQYEAQADRRAKSEDRRDEEATRKALAKQKGEPFQRGVDVRLKDGQHGAFVGMVGRVVASDPGNTVIEFTGYRRNVTIRTSLLDLDGVGA